ncbi:MAG: type I 3-dehydroquinate dehydratase [Deltaproteobacteria bacterium]|nr:type I 3-dehydroquinate dehydratase [Deltaproteobacteria bacterium]
MICIPVTATSTAMARVRMEHCAPHADMIELRIDRIDGPKLPELLGETPCPVIVTNRKKAEGGYFSGSEEERISTLLEAVRLKAGYVDIELSAGEEATGRLKEAIGANGSATRLIVSYHNFAETPPDGVLRNILTEAAAVGADIVKIATWATVPADNIRILSFLEAMTTSGADVIAFCMGTEGRVSRLLAPVFGSYLSYAALEKGMESAPGQFTAGEMRRFLEMLRS